MQPVFKIVLEYVDTPEQHRLRPLNLVQVLALPLYDMICRLNKSEESFEHALESIRDRLNS